MLVLIVISIVAMAVETMRTLPDWIREGLGLLNLVMMVIFTLEYGLRVWTARQRWRYVFSFWGLVDLVSFLPFWLSVGTGSQAIRILRMMRLLKLMRYIAAIDRMRRAFELVWRELLVVLMMAVMMMFITAVGIYNFESEAQPQHFGSIPQSLWFAVTTLTTVGYGDSYPVTTGGKFFTFLILMIGLGVVALPAGVVSSGLSQAREEERERKAAEKLRRANGNAEG
jgi:voltage-gated potassium channel